MLILQKVHNIWSKLTVRGVSAKQSVEIVHRALVKSENCHRTASPPDLAHCGGEGVGQRSEAEGTKKIITRFLQFLPPAVGGKN